ncbi:ScbA/BarX family gamma-butyrolactone biosynthesis protein [Streptomyces sp. NPDC006450]|uniref:ScbA/BarX family gamma-butyrolactone biosynthesis protein n=1 Tax=Streptomyces sp. NPDC006450 TaxID=3155458 RepID=UPI0033A54A06
MITTLEPTVLTTPTPAEHCACQAQTDNRLATTVPRALVHRAAVAEVFLTGMCRIAEDRFHIKAQWPRGHSFFAPVAGTHYDPMLIAETIRQVGAYLAHEAFDVPIGHQFLLWSLEYSTVPEQLAMGEAPADLDLIVTCPEIRRRGNRLTALTYEVVIRQGDRVIATGRVGYTVTSPAVYQRLRAKQLSRQPDSVLGPAPVAPAEVGRLSPFDVVLSASCGPGVWQLRYDIRHPVLFDHVGDHVPGMVLLEAARQAVTIGAEAGVMPVTVRSTYQRYAEFGSPLWIHAEPASADLGGTAARSIRVTGVQDGEQVFEAVVVTEPVGTVASLL